MYIHVYAVERTHCGGKTHWRENTMERTHKHTVKGTHTVERTHSGGNTQWEHTIEGKYSGENTQWKEHTMEERTYSAGKTQGKT